MARLVFRFTVILGALVLASGVALAAGGSSGHGGGMGGAHGGMKPSGAGGGGHNPAAGHGPRIPETPPDLLQQRIQRPRA